MMLSVRASESEKALALDAGANDYVTKPFGVQELLARVRNLLRVRERGERGGGVFDDGRLRIDLGARRVTLEGQPVHLARKEYAVLRALVANPGRVVTQSQLLRETWDRPTSRTPTTCASWWPRSAASCKTRARSPATWSPRPGSATASWARTAASEADRPRGCAADGPLPSRSGYWRSRILAIWTVLFRGVQKSSQ